MLASFLGPVIFSLASRFDMLAYRKISYYALGFVMFSLYMRLFLTPISLLTWANLNHSLCGSDTDPFWLHFGLGKWYYILAEFYLGAAAIALGLINYAICYFVKRIVLNDDSCSHETFWSVTDSKSDAKKSD